MVPHLTLVSDEPEAGVDASLPGQPRPRPSLSAWVRRAWRPSPPLEQEGGRRSGPSLLKDERGAVTAEYAIVIMAAVAFAGLLVAIMQSSEIRAMLVQLVQNALGSAG
ncbi:DUF4244 domain-containing protein [Leucobacter chromiisoli]|uniref:DUF4244 domain-containing protein n=1 Tax=Leucobacter chromiisoli TaxID=2796471 RepID=UPI0027DB0903|nr:DUF4244 domain-containing protein [Leucobacter chromiisoli]